MTRPRPRCAPLARARRRRAALAVAGAALAAGCLPPFPGGAARAARTSVPRTFGVGAVESSSSAWVDWRAFFPDPYLVALIDVALQNNQELNIAVQEILIADNEVMARRGE